MRSLDSKEATAFRARLRSAWGGCRASLDQRRLTFGPPLIFLSGNWRGTFGAATGTSGEEARPKIKHAAAQFRLARS